MSERLAPQCVQNSQVIRKQLFKKLRKKIYIYIVLKYLYYLQLYWPHDVTVTYCLTSQFISTDQLNNEPQHFSFKSMELSLKII